MKYVDTMVTFAEFPDEVALCINISNCPCHCPGCHSEYLADDIGDELTPESLDELINKNSGITCVGLMGGDSDPSYITVLAKSVKESHPELKVGWYSGRQTLSKDINLDYFDYYKLGPYIEERGPLNNPNTNQVFYSRGEHMHKMSAYPGSWYDITDRFWTHGK